jgi:hypothetical protein
MNQHKYYFIISIIMSKITSYDKDSVDSCESSNSVKYTDYHVKKAVPSITKAGDLKFSDHVFIKDYDKLFGSMSDMVLSGDVGFINKYIKKIDEITDEINKYFKKNVQKDGTTLCFFMCIKDRELFMREKIKPDTYIKVNLIRYTVLHINFVWANNDYLYDKKYLDIWCENGKIHRSDDIAALTTGFDVIDFKLWYKNGELFRNDDYPSIHITRYLVAFIENIKIWHIGGNISRSNGYPSYIKTVNSSFPEFMFMKDHFRVKASKINKWYYNNKLHRDGDKPAKISFYENEKITCQQWCQYGELHRDGDKPAIISFDNNGEIIDQTWYQHGEVHRDGDKPSKIIPYAKCWYNNGELHRDNDLPAIIIKKVPVMIYMCKDFGMSILCMLRKYIHEICIYEDSEYWFQHGNLYRDGDKPMAICSSKKMIFVDGHFEVPHGLCCMIL